ncbi:MAG: hypothetical protein ACK5P6_02765 [Pseudobdellovibrionaceae bacterium]
MKYLLAVLVAYSLGACQSSGPRSNQYRTAEEERPIVDSKYSLSADRAQLEEFRKEIPESTREQNDEMAFVLGLMAKSTKPPAEIRTQFNGIVRKKREQFDKDIRKERETFTVSERKKRDVFLKSLNEERAEALKAKPPRERRAEIIKDIDQRRAEFFSVERDRRNDFESDVRERRKNFEDYARAKTNEFNQEMNTYSKNYDRLKKEEQDRKMTKSATRSEDPSQALAEVSSELEQLERELQKFQGVPGTPLRSGFKNE